MDGIEWLTARPVAHRGLHGNGIVENSLSAASAAVAANYAIEVDLQFSSDGEVVVFHDGTLERLTIETGDVASRTAAELKAIKLNNTNDTIPSLHDLLALVGGKVPLVLELKSQWDGKTDLAHKVADILADYEGPVAVMSFDPDLVAALKTHAPGLPRGIVAERRYLHPFWNFLSPGKKRYLGLLLHILRTKPHFVAYAQFDMPAIAPLITRYVFGMPLLSWTVRTEKERAKVSRWVNQIIFEHIRPE
jgi:glycerophosphoryl diester phosphodiesterase